MDPENGAKIDAFLVRLRACAVGEAKFTFVMRDPSGNSFVENKFLPAPDPCVPFSARARLLKAIQYTNGPGDQPRSLTVTPTTALSD